MAIDRAALEELTRDELVAEARRFGVKRPEVMTRVELADEVLRLGTPNPVERKKVRGWLGVARDLIASVVEQGLNLPDAAALIRGDVRFEPLRAPQPPVATVTLAEIYGAQGHHGRALSILDEVLAKEPDHDVARRLRDKLAAERSEKRSSPRRADADERSAEGISVGGDAEQSPAAAPDDDDPETLLPAPPGEAGAAEAVVGVARVDDDDDDDDDAETLLPAARSETPAETPAPDADDQAQTLPPAEPVVDMDAMTIPPPLGVILGRVAAIAAPPRLPDLSSPSSDPEPLTPRRLRPLLPPTDVAALFARTSPANLVAYFELGVAGFAPDGGAVLRVVEMRPRERGVERVERDIRVSGERGTVDVVALEAGSVVRVALGTKNGAEFRALAVAAEVSLSPSGVSVAWAPRASVDYPAIASRFGHLLAGSLRD